MDDSALCHEQVRDGVTDRHPTRAPRMDGPRRVERDELEVDPAPVQRVVPTVGVSRRYHFAKHVMEPGRRQEEIEEPRPGDLDVVEVRRRRRFHGGLDAVGDLARRQLRRLRHLQGDGAGPVSPSVIQIPRLERDPVRRLGEPGRTQRVTQAVTELVTDHEAEADDTQRVAIGASYFRTPEEYGELPTAGPTRWYPAASRPS